MEEKINLEMLMKGLADAMKPVLDPVEEFRELCAFAEDTGWKKVCETEAGVKY